MGADFTSVADGVVRDPQYVSTFNGGSAEALYCSAAILPGNSGSAILDDTGAVIGVASWAATHAGDVQSNFVGGVNSHVARPLVEYMTEHRRPRPKGYLGIWRATVVAPHLLRLSFEYRDAGGLFVAEIDPAGPFARAGGAAGDIIVALDDQSVGPFAHQTSLTRHTWARAPGDQVTLTVVRPPDPRHTWVTVALGDLPSASRHLQSQHV
jgi:S1-C subfamily serine protease